VVIVAALLIFGLPATVAFAQAVAIDDRADTTTADTTTADTTTADTNRQAGVITDTIPDQKRLVNTGGPALVLMPALGLLLISSLVLKNLLRR
jgi:hypothetical protein